MELREVFELVRSFRKEKFESMALGEIDDMHLLVPVSKLVEEVGELVQLHNIQLWNKRKVQKDEFAEELVDILFFIVDVCDRLGITVSDIEKKFKEKLEKNYKRFDSRGVFI